MYFIAPSTGLIKVVVKELPEWWNYILPITIVLTDPRGFTALKRPPIV
jgi:hypothetical protein